MFFFFVKSSFSSQDNTFLPRFFGHVEKRLDKKTNAVNI